MLIQCTKKLLDELGIKALPLQKGEGLFTAHCSPRSGDSVSIAFLTAAKRHLLSPDEEYLEIKGLWERIENI